MEDWQLLEAWCGGDDRAGEILLGRYMETLTRFFMKKVRDPAVIGDLVSDTMLVCTRSRERIRDSHAFRHFLFSAAMNKYRQFCRKQAKRMREHEDFARVCSRDPNDDRSPLSVIDMKDEGRLLVRLLRQLPMEQQIAIEMGYVESLEGPEIAKLLGVPLRTIYSRQRRGIRKLKAMLENSSAPPDVVTSASTGIHSWAQRIRLGITPPGDADNSVAVGGG